MAINKEAVKDITPISGGRNSHHPLMAFVSQTRMVANAWLRPGNTAASSSCKLFMEETFKQALKGKKVGLVREDSGFLYRRIDALSRRRKTQLHHGCTHVSQCKKCRVGHKRLG